MSDTSKPATFSHETHSREAGIAETGRTADAWWAWHDADSSRLSATLEEAEERCDAWVAGESDDGPSQRETPARATWEVGDRVEGGDPGAEDHDTGRVIAVTTPGSRAADDFGGGASTQPRVLVGWDTGVQTWHDADELFPEVR